MRSLHNSPSNPATKNVPDIQKYGLPDNWMLVCKASSQKEGWMRSTKAMNLAGGCLIQVSTYDNGQIAEAITFVPNTDFNKDTGTFT